MSLFAFPPVEPTTRMPIGRVDIPLGEWTGFRYREAAGQTMGGRLGDLFDELTDNSPYLPPDKANAMFGVPDLDGLPNSGLKFDKPIRHETAMHRNRRKLQELEDINVRELASHSNFGWKAWGSFALGALPGSMSHPLDVAVNFIPFVGSATRAEALAAKGAGAFRQSLARGLYTTEQIAQYTRFAPLATAIINGAAGNAFAEIPVAIQNFRDQRIYGFGDAALNVAVGGVAGGALHVAFKGVGKVFDALSPETRNRAAKTAVAQAMAGQDIDVRNVVSIDRDAIEAASLFNEVEARKALAESIGAKFSKESAEVKALLDTLNVGRSNANDLLKLLTIAARSSSDATVAKIAGAILRRFKEGERSATLFQQAAQLFDVRYDPTVRGVDDIGDRMTFQADIESRAVTAGREAKALRGQLFQLEKVLKETLERQVKESDPLVQQRLSANSHRLQLERAELISRMETLDKSIQQRADTLSPDEMDAHLKELQAKGELVTDADIRARALELQSFIDEQMQMRIEESIYNQRQQYDSKAVEQRLVEDAITTQQALGKVMSDEDVKTFTQKDVPDPAEMKVLEEDVKNLEQQLMGKQEPLVEQDVAVRVKQMKDGKVVSGTVTMKPKAALKALEGRAKILKQLMDCLNG